jgi:hypothetical protein
MKDLIYVTALAMVVVLAQPRAAHAHDNDHGPGHVRPPRVPGNIEVEAGNKAFLEGHAVGTQNYICLPSGTSFTWTFFGPQATLFNDDDRQIITHFLSANPDEIGTPPRASWQHSRDSSMVWAVLRDPNSTSSDPQFVAQGAIPWLLLKKVGAQEGPTGGGTLAHVSFIHRVNTSGGVAPSTGCAVATDVGKKALVPYTADYFFYRHHAWDTDDDN